MTPTPVRGERLPRRSVGGTRSSRWVVVLLLVLVTVVGSGLLRPTSARELEPPIRSARQAEPTDEPDGLRRSAVDGRNLVAVLTASTLVLAGLTLGTVRLRRRGAQDSTRRGTSGLAGDDAHPDDGTDPGDGPAPAGDPDLDADRAGDPEDGIDLEPDPRARAADAPGTAAVPQAQPPTSAPASPASLLEREERDADTHAGRQVTALETAETTVVLFDRRLGQRVPFASHARLQWDGHDLAGTTVDLSMTGVRCRLPVERPAVGCPRVGTTVRVTLLLNGALGVFTARVQWVSGADGSRSLGLQFVDVQAAEEALLEPVILAAAT